MIIAIVLNAFFSSLKLYISLTIFASSSLITISLCHFLIVILLYQKGALPKNLLVLFTQDVILSFTSLLLSSLSILDNDKSNCNKNLSLELSAMYCLLVQIIHLI